MDQVVAKLKEFTIKTEQVSRGEFTTKTNDSKEIDSSTNEQISNGGSSKIIHWDTLIKQNIDINYNVIDELVNITFKMINEGKKENVKQQHIFDYINNHKIFLQDIYNWLLKNQNNSNSIYLLGYFNHHGLGTDVNKQKALELYQEAANLENNLAQYYLAWMYKNGEGVNKDYDKSFELFKRSAEGGCDDGIVMLGYCYEKGIGTDIIKQKASELYQKAAN